MWCILLVHSDKTTLKLAHLLHLHVRNLRLTELRCLAQRTPSWRVPRSLLLKLVLPVVSHCLSRHCVHGIWLDWPDLVSIWQLNNWANLSSRCLVGTMSDVLNISQAHCYNLKREIGALLLLLLSCFSRVRPSRPHRLQPTRLLRPWDFPGKSTGVGCHCVQLCVTP